MKQTNKIIKNKLNDKLLKYEMQHKINFNITGKKTVAKISAFKTF